MGESVGDCHVPRRYKDDAKLGWWVSEQRRRYRLLSAEGDKLARKTPLIQSQINLLEEIGFEWTAKDQSSICARTWMESYNMLKEYKQSHGDCRAPPSYDPQLGRWVKRQRRLYNLSVSGEQSVLDSSRIKLLEEIGFEWSTKEVFSKEWKENYDKLKAHKESEGDCIVSP